MKTDTKARLKKIILAGSSVIGLALLAYGGLLLKDQWWDQRPVDVSKKQETYSTLPVHFDVPYLTHIQIDGNGSDWQDNGFYVPSLEASLFSPEDATLSGSARVAWCDEGMLLYAEINEPAYAREIDKSILNASEFSIRMTPGNEEEIAADSRGGYAITIRRAGDIDERVLVYDSRPSKLQQSEPLQPVVRTVSTSSGYLVEALLPFGPMGMKPEEGRITELNIDASVSDGNRHESKQLWRYVNASKQLPVIRLAKTSSPPVLSYASCAVALRKSDKSYSELMDEYDARGETLADMLEDGINYDKLRAETNERRFYTISLEPSQRVSGKTMYVKDQDGTILAQTPYKSQDLTTVEIDARKKGDLHDNLKIYVDNTLVTKVSPFHNNGKTSQPADRPDRLFMDSYVFAGKDFPAAQLAEPILAKQTLGAYTLKTSYYDEDMNEVQQADKPGRYGAVTVVEAQEGSLFRMYSTLLRDDTLAQNLPGIEGPAIPRVRDEEIIAIEQLAARERDPSQLKLISDSKDRQYSAFDLNQEWWLELREKLNIKFPWIVTLPPDYSDDKKWPVVVYLHGGGAQDIEDLNVNIMEEDFTQIIRGGEGPFGGTRHAVPNLDKPNPDNETRKLPVIVLQPQLSVGDLRWTGPIMRQVIKQAAHEYSIDEDRVIITGYCGGAGGAYRIAASAPELFAGFISLTIGRYGMDGAYKLKHVPTWAFTGADDVSPIPVHSENLVNAINEAGGNAKLEILEGVAHDTEGVVWKRDDVWEWLLAQRRHKPLVTASEIKRPEPKAQVQPVSFE